MAKMSPQRKVLRKVLREQPCSIRRLSLDSSVPYSNLMEAKEGIRPVSEGMARKVVGTLRDWADHIDRLADELEAVMEGGNE